MAVSSGAEEGDLAAGVRPDRSAVQGFAVRQQFCRLAEPLIVKLRILVAAFVLEIDIGAARGVRRKRRLSDRLVQESQLTPIAACLLQQVQLIDIAESSSDQQLSLRRPAERR